jgi:ABC-type multidrug transport system fused ATPase/permease subunit
MSTPPRLEMIDVRKRFGATVALDGVDFSVAASSVHALVGENGAGKSTLMKILSGAIRPDSGSMRLDGEDYSPRAGDPDRVGLAIEDASFGYDGAPVLRELSVRVNPGERIGIVGTSGVGKTTFVRLAMAIVAPSAGTVRFFDENGWSENACPASRRFISYVPQGNTLISGTIRKNLLSGRADATEADMWRALEAADAAEFVRKLPDGLDAALGEHAGGLSEGQAQRVAIARALIRNRPLLILDEATSALDEKTEARVLENISRAMDATCLIVTHRRSMLKYCDKVLEIDAGRVNLIDTKAVGA